MTDQELIQRLLEKSAGELTPDEIEAIRARWTQSPELRQALVDHLRLETLLTGSLGTRRLDVDTILKSAEQNQRNRRRSHHYWFWIAGLCLVFLVGGGALLLRPKPQPQEQMARDLHNAPAIPQQQPQQDVAQTEPSRIEKDPVEPTVAEVAPVQEEMASSAKSNVVPSHEDPALIQVAQNEPWSTAFSRNVAPWPVSSPNWTSSFKAAEHDEFPDSEGKRWLASIDGQPYNWSTEPSGNPARRIARFNGLAKMRAPWPQDGVLRVTPFEINELTLYFWRGPTGVALRFNTRREPHLWAAFEISRENSSPKPTRWGLLTTDNGSYSRSTEGTFDIRQQGEDLVLARGGIVLLSVPFLGPPVEVFVEGQFRLRGFSMHRSAPFLTLPESTHPTIISGSAANLPWAISAENPASLKENDDRSLTATFDSRNANGIASLPFGWMLAMQQSARATGLYEVIVCVASADPGTGIYLGDRNGRPIHQLGFFRDNSTQQVTFGTLRPGQNHTEQNFNPQDYAPPYLSKPGWFKLTAGLGTFHIQTSGDGRHWGHVVENPARDWPGAVGSMGLYGLAGQSARSIQIRQVQVRELNGITDLADANLRKLVAPFTQDQLNNLSHWKHRVFDTQPIDADPVAWFTTNAIVALSQGPSRETGLGLLQQLISTGIKSEISIEQKLRLLDDACSLCDLFDDGSARQIGKWYEELGWQLAKSGNSDPLTTIRPAWLWSSIWTASKMKYIWEPLLSHEILHALYDRDWATSWRLAQSTSYWNLQVHPDIHPVDRGEFLERHAKWAKSIIADAAPQFDDGSASILPSGLRHPLLPVLNKEAYNMRAELQSALSGASYEDACRILISISPTDGQGLLPDVEDRDLYVSMQTALTIARKSHPGFAEMMTEKFQPLGIIRVKSAINRRDLAGLQAATLQFMGTDAARNAHAWLGDLAVSAGHFDSAEQHFRKALSEADETQRQSLEPRILLARALSGQLTANEWTAGLAGLREHPTDFNGKVSSREEFVALVEQIMAQNQKNESLTSPSPQTAIVLKPSAYQLEPRSQFDGHPGTNPGRWEFRFGDPIARQLSTIADDQRIYVSNRFQVNAYAANSGQQLWAQGLGSEQGDAYAMPFTPMRPLPAGDRIYVRRLTNAGAELACLNASSGQVIWNRRPFQSALSDPVIWHGKLFSLVLTKIEENLMQVEAAWFDFKTGDIVASRPLFRLQEIPDRQFSAQLTINGQTAVCTVAGTTASFDSQGEVQWIRRHLLMLKQIDELYEDQRMSPPTIVGDRVIVSLPGVRAVYCLELATGRILWQQPITNLRGLMGASESRVLVDAVSSLVALDIATGQIAWTYDADSRLEGMLIEAPQVLVSRRVTFPNNRSKPLMVWLDLESGHELAQTLLQTADREEFQFGPLFSAGGKQWALVGQSWKESKREIVEIVSANTAAPEPFLDQTLEAWSSPVPDSKLAEIQAIVPGWFTIADYQDRVSFHPESIQGETFSILSRVDSQNEIRFSHHFNFPAGRQQKLLLRVANQPGQKWKLTVRLHHQILHSQVIGDSNGQSGWRNVVMDLSQLAGKKGSLVLIQSSAEQTASDALWKQAQFIVE